MIENQKEKIWKSNKFLHKSPWFRNGIYSLLSRADARGSADIYHIWRISLLCRSGCHWSQKVGHAKNI